jgi:hypothetical protein
MDPDEQEIAEIGIRGNAINYFTNSSFVVLKSGIALDTWYKVQLEFREYPTRAARYRVNDEAWSDWVTRGNPSSTKKSSYLAFHTTSMSAARTTYYDDLLACP